MSVRLSQEEINRQQQIGHAQWVREGIAKLQVENAQFQAALRRSLPRSAAELRGFMRAIELDERASTGALGQVMGMRDGALPTPPEPDDGTNEMALAMATAAAAVLVTGLRRVVNRWQTASTPAEQASAQAEMDVQFETLAAEMRNMELKAAVQADYIAQLEAAGQRGNERAAQAAPAAAERQEDRRARAEARMARARQVTEQARQRAESRRMARESQQA